jgi:hypothetical protein
MAPTVGSDPRAGGAGADTTVSDETNSKSKAESDSGRGNKLVRIPDDEYWKIQRESYFLSKGDSDKSHDDRLREMLDKYPHGGSLIDYEVRTGPYGRGVFTKQQIKKGTRVWVTEIVGVFRSKEQFETFLGLLPHKHMRVDACSWSYCRIPGCVHLDLNPMAVMNHGGPPGSNRVRKRGWKNVQPESVKECKVDDEWQYYATHDMEPGHELLVDYDTFHSRDNQPDWYEEIWEQIMS